MTASVSSRGARGGAVTIFGQIVKIGVQIVSVTVLSRLLDPADFGLIAMTTVFIALGELFRDFGMPTAALQARKLSHQQASNLFWINTAMGTVIGILLVLCIPMIVSLYDEPRLASIIPVLALSVVIGGATAQFQIHLARELKYFTLTIATISSQIVGLCVAVVSALMGMGFWALAWQIVASSISLFIIQIIFARWLPSIPRVGVGTRSLIKSGLSFGGSHFLTYTSKQTDTLLIGWRWEATAVGEYNRAFQLLSMPVQSMMAPLTNVVVPIVNRQRDNGKTVDSILLRVQFLIAGATVWVFLLAATSANFLIPLLLGPGWDASILLFQILAVGGIFHAFSFVSYWGFILYDQSHQLFRYNLVTKTLTVLAIFSASFISIEAIAVAYSLTMALSWPINLIWLHFTTPQDSRSYFSNGMKIVIAALISGVVGLMEYDVVSQFLPASVTAFTVGASSTAIFLLILYFIPGGRRELSMAFDTIKLVRRR